MNEAYNMFKEAIELEKENSDYFVLQEFMDAAARKMKSDEAYKEQFIQITCLHQELLMEL